MDKLREEAMNHAKALYPMANVDDYPDNPNVNRINRACLGAFGNGYDYASQQTASLQKQLGEQEEKLHGMWEASERLRKQDQEEIERLRDIAYRALNCADHVFISTVREIQKELLQSPPGESEKENNNH